MAEKPVEVHVDTSGIKKEMLDEVRRIMKEAVAPKQKPQSLNEAVEKGPVDYKEKLCEMIKTRQRINTKGLTSKELYKLSEAIGAISGGSAIPDVWATEVERLHVYPASKFLSVPGLVNWKETVAGVPGSITRVPTVDKATAADVSEGSEPSPTASTISGVDINLKTIAAAYYMTTADAEELLPSAIDGLNDGLGTALGEKVDSDFLTWIYAPKTNTCGTLTTAALSSIAITGSLIARIIGSMRAGTYEPAFLMVHPVTMTKLLQNQQFYDVSQFGNREVIERGAVANYFGVDIVMCHKVYSTGGTYKSVLLAKGALLGAIKRKPEVQTDYIIETGRHYIRMDMRWGGTIGHPDGVFQLHTVD